MNQTFNKDNIIFISGWIKENNELKVISVPYFISDKDTCINLLTKEFFVSNNSIWDYDIAINAFQEQYNNYNKYDINDLATISNRPEIIHLPSEYKDVKEYDINSILNINEAMKKQALLKLRVLLSKNTTTYKYDNDKVYFAIKKEKELYSSTSYYLKNGYTIVNLVNSKEYMLDHANIEGVKEIFKKENNDKAIDIVSLKDEYNWHAKNIKLQSGYAAVLRKLWRGKSSLAEIEAIGKYLKSTYRFREQNNIIHRK